MSSGALKTLSLVVLYLVQGCLGQMLRGLVCKSPIRKVVGAWAYPEVWSQPAAQKGKLTSLSPGSQNWVKPALKTTTTTTTTRKNKKQKNTILNYISICYERKVKISNLPQKKLIFGSWNSSVNADDSARQAAFYVEMQRLVLCSSYNLSII